MEKVSDESSLDKIYRRANEATGLTLFFTSIFEYLTEASRQHGFGEALKVLEQQRSVDTKATGTLRGKVRELVDGIIFELSELKKTYNIPREIADWLGIADKVLRGKGGFAVDGELGAMQILCDIPENTFKSPDHLKTLQEVLGITWWPDGSGIKSCRAVELKAEFDNEYEKLQRVRESSAWYSWEKLQWFQEAWQDDYSRFKTAGMPESFIAKLKDEIRILSEWPEDEAKLEYFKRELYKGYFERFHRFLFNFSDSQSLMPTIVQKTYACTEAAGEFIVRICDKRFSYTLENTQKARLLKALIMGKGEEVMFDDVIELLDTDAVQIIRKIKSRIGATRPEKLKCYNLCRALKNDFADKGINDFLAYDFNKVSVQEAFKWTKW